MYKGRLQILPNGIFSLSGNSSTFSSPVRAPLAPLVSRKRMLDTKSFFLVRCLLMNSIRAFLMRLLNGPGFLRIVFAVPF